MADFGNGVRESEIRKRALSLFTFLRELAALGTKTVRDLKEYETVVWFSEIPREEECYCIAWAEQPEPDEETWVEIKKPRLKPPPDPP